MTTRELDLENLTDEEAQEAKDFIDEAYNKAALNIARKRNARQDEKDREARADNMEAKLVELSAHYQDLIKQPSKNKDLIKETEAQIDKLWKQLEILKPEVTKRAPANYLTFQR